MGVWGPDYGSERWLRGDPEGQREALHLIRRGGHALCIEAPSEFLLSRYDPLGLQLSASCTPAESDLVERALDRIARVPTLFASILALVRSMHLLVADEGYDVSHSDPALPFSIFCSVPSGQPQAELRLAESIIHEGMHLQLTLLEARYPLVRSDEETKLFSPWQGVDRPLGGLIHGLYVFTVIDAFLARTSGGAPDDEQAFIDKRRATIAAEMDEVQGLEDQAGLTDCGREFLRIIRVQRLGITGRGSLRSSR